jgi:DNA-binding transcriptional LysR family regulator
LAISAAVDGTGVAMESIRLAEREISRGELVELGAGLFESLALETHFVSCRTDERQLKKVRMFREWLFNAAGVIAT